MYFQTVDSLKWKRFEAKTGQAMNAIPGHHEHILGSATIAQEADGKTTM